MYWERSLRRPLYPVELQGQADLLAFLLLREYNKPDGTGNTYFYIFGFITGQNYKIAVK